jgi:biopolymer transport protein ExbD
MAGSTLDNGGAPDPFQAPGKLMADINVTPMVDVMLVLLIIFMVTAPLLVAGLPVELPKTNAQPLPQDKKRVTVSLAADGSLAIEDERVDLTSLVPKLSALRASQDDDTVNVKADKKVPYGDVLELLSKVRASGFQHFSLLSTPAPKEPDKAPAP